jgi:hypothetical protein
MESLKLNDLQTIFFVFYAIFWGYIAGVQPRWKAFNFPMIVRVPQAACRTLLAFVIFNVIPIFFLWFALKTLNDLHVKSYWNFVRNGVLPAFATFSFIGCG